MAMKRVPVCFNLENESHEELYEMLRKKFNKNMSSGIRGILFAYFNNANQSQSYPIITQQEDTDNLATVL